jgi:pimeloyl-ACP methyl ester carboxylesterase
MLKVLNAGFSSRRRLAACHCAVMSFAMALLGAVQPPVAAAGAPFGSESIQFSNADVTLKGAIVRAKRPFAAAVIVHGSGQEKRMTEFATILATRGVTTLTYDKRGVGESGGVYAGPEVGTNNVDPANLDLLASDAMAAVRTLASKLGPKRRPMGLVGFSQAGWVIPIAAKRDASVNFVVLFSGPLVTTREQLRFQFMTNGDDSFWDMHSETYARERMRTDPDRYEFVDTDPRESLAALSIPGLWIFGGRDTQLPAQLSIERLEALMAQGKRFEHRLYPALGHNTGFSGSSEPVAAAIQWMKLRAGGR